MTQGFREVMMVGIGGFMGALMRYGTATVVARFFTSSFMTGTLVVNTLGCLLMGIAAAFLQQQGGADHPLRLFFVVGVLGAFTTFSALSYELFAFIQEGRLLLASAYLALSLVMGLCALGLGQGVALSLLTCVQSTRLGRQ